MRKPSPALIVACVALFCSLGGVSYGVATGFIDSREIKNNTIRAKDIRNGQVTSADLRNDNVSGADVNESSLGKVPTAASADSAAKATNATNATNAATAGNAAHATTASNASNADAVGGVRERAINVRLNGGTSAAEVFSFGGLRIVMDCVTLGGGGDASFYLDSTLANAEAVAAGFNNDGAGPGAGNVEEYAAPDDFDPGDIVPLGPGTDGFPNLFSSYEINYVAPSGSVVTASIAVSETTNAFGGTADCIMYGHARQSG
jgi:hypothetical protein